MNPINITVKSKKFETNYALWSLRLTNGSCRTFMCDTGMPARLTIYREDAVNITVVAELAAIWTALQQIRGYQWIEINSNNETEAVIIRFLYHQPPTATYFL